MSRIFPEDEYCKRKWIDAQFDDSDFSHLYFKQFLKEFEMKIFEKAGKNSEKWLGRKMIPFDPEYMNAFMTMIVRKNRGRDGTHYPDSTKFKINDTTQFFNEDGKPMSIDDIAGCGWKARFVISFTLYVGSHKVSPVWKIEQAKMYRSITIS